MGLLWSGSGDLWVDLGGFRGERKEFSVHTQLPIYIYICAHFPASAFGRGAMDGGDGGIGDGVVVVVVVDTQRFHGRMILSNVDCICKYKDRISCD